MAFQVLMPEPQLPGQPVELTGSSMCPSVVSMILQTCQALSSQLREYRGTTCKWQSRSSFCMVDLRLFEIEKSRLLESSETESVTPEFSPSARGGGGSGPATPSKASLLLLASAVGSASPCSSTGDRNSCAKWCPMDPHPVWPSPLPCSNTS